MLVSRPYTTGEHSPIKTCTDIVTVRRTYQKRDVPECQSSRTRKKVILHLMRLTRDWNIKLGTHTRMKWQIANSDCASHIVCVCVVCRVWVLLHFVMLTHAPRRCSTRWKQQSSSFAITEPQIGSYSCPYLLSLTIAPDALDRQSQHLAVALSDTAVGSERFKIHN